MKKRRLQGQSEASRDLESCQGGAGLGEEDKQYVSRGWEREDWKRSPAQGEEQSRLDSGFCHQTWSLRHRESLERAQGSGGQGHEGAECTAAGGFAAKAAPPLDPWTAGAGEDPGTGPAVADGV